MKPLHALSLMLLALCFSQCKSTERMPAEHTYQIRGVIVTASVNQQGAKEIKMRHEAIPEFFDAQGKAEPMHAMTMSFPVDPQIDIGDLKKGDEIEATYEVRWKSSPREIISKLSKLPAGSVSFARK